MKNSETAKFQWTEEDSNKQEKITTNTRKHRESSRHYFSYQNIGETCRAENDVAELWCYPPQPELVHRHQLPPAPQQSLAAASQQQQPLQITLCQQPPLLYYILYFSSIYLHFNFVFDLFHMVVNCTVQDLYRKMWPIVRNDLIPLSPTSPPLLPVTCIILGVPLKDLLGAPSPQVLEPVKQPGRLWRHWWRTPRSRWSRYRTCSCWTGSYTWTPCNSHILNM